MQATRYTEGDTYTRRGEEPSLVHTYRIESNNHRKRKKNTGA